MRASSCQVNSFAAEISTRSVEFASTLRMLAEAIEVHECGGDPVTDEDLEKWGLEDTEPGDKELPDFMK